MDATYTRIHALTGIKIKDRDGNVTTFGSEAMYAVFLQGLSLSRSDTLYDEIDGQWVVGTLDQLVS